MKPKKVSKQNIQKLRLYLAKQNDIKPGNRPNKDAGTKPQTNQ